MLWEVNRLKLVSYESPGMTNRRHPFQRVIAFNLGHRQAPYLFRKVICGVLQFLFNHFLNPNIVCGGNAEGSWVGVRRAGHTIASLPGGTRWTVECCLIFKGSLMHRISSVKNAKLLM